MSERQLKAVASDTVQTTTYRRDNPCGCPSARLYIKFPADRGEPCPYGRRLN
ncbi:MAG: hypothetical protein PUA67_02280 [Ruminococcus sp.]|nr:hypothetical protein [Ruminococcus sp.]